MTGKLYTYYGVLVGDRTPDNPGGVIRVWTGPDGEQMEETFMISLRWERSDRFSPMSRDDFGTTVEIDESVVERFIQRMKEKYTAKRDG